MTRADDGNGAGRVLETLLADRAEPKPEEATSATRANDEEFGVLGRVKEHLSGEAVNRGLVNAGRFLI